MCLDGDYKEHGIRFLHGFASDYALTDANFVVPVLDELKHVAVLLEPLSIAEKALYQAMKIQQRLKIWTPKRVLVLGAGALGLLVTILLRSAGFDVSTVARQAPESLKVKIVNSVGASYINSVTNPLDSLDQKYDLIVEATGNAQVAIQSTRFLSANGVLCLLGVYSSRIFSYDMGDLLREVVLGNKLVFGSVNANKRYFELGLQHMSKVKEMFPDVLERMITSRLPPDRIIADETLEQGMKSVRVKLPLSVLNSVRSMFVSSSYRWFTSNVSLLGRCRSILLSFYPVVLRIRLASQTSEYKTNQ